MTRIEGSTCISIRPIYLRIETGIVHIKILTIGIQLIQRSIVHSSKHLSISRCTLRCLYRQTPLLFLSGTQLITEYIPFHCQCFIRHTLLQVDLFRIEFTTLDKSKQVLYPVSILLFIRNIKTNNRVG